MLELSLVALPHPVSPARLPSLLPATNSLPLACPHLQEPADLAATSEGEESSDSEGGEEPAEVSNPHQALVPAGVAAKK